MVFILPDGIFRDPKFPEFDAIGFDTIFRVEIALFGIGKETSKKLFTQRGVELRYPISGVLHSVGVSF